MGGRARAARAAPPPRVTGDLAALDAALRRLEPPAGAPGLSPLERARLGASLAGGLEAVATEAPDPAWEARLAQLHGRLTEAFARNPHLPVAWQVALVAAADGPTHVALAARSDLTAGARLALLDSPEATVRSRVLEAGDQALAERALSHADPWLRAAAAARSGWSDRQFAALAADPDPRVRRRVAENPSAPRRALSRLGRDADPGVRRVARAHPAWAPGWWERWWGA